MNCDTVLQSIPLYFYGELAPPDEDKLEDHLHSCPACAREMERQRALAAALAGRQGEPSVAFLDECRQDLMAAIAGSDPHRVVAPRQPYRRPGPGPWRLF